MEDRLTKLERNAQSFQEFIISVISTFASTNHLSTEGVIQQLQQTNSLEDTTAKAINNQYNQLLQEWKQKQSLDNQCIQQDNSNHQEDNNHNTLDFESQETMRLFSQLEEKMDQQMMKIIYVEQQMADTAQQLTHKASKVDLKSIADLTKNTLTDLTVKQKQLADKDSMSYLLKKTEEIVATIETLVTKQNFKESTEIMLTDFRQVIESFLKDNYQSKEDTKNEIITIMGIIEGIQAQQNSLDQKVQQLVTDIKLTTTNVLKQLNGKSDQTIVQALSDSLTQQINHSMAIQHKQEELSSELIKSQGENTKMQQMQHAMQEVIHRIDETLLLKSEKLDLQQLELDIELKYLTKEENFINNRNNVKAMEDDKSQIVKIIETKYVLQTDKLAESVYPVILTQLNPRFQKLQEVNKVLVKDISQIKDDLLTKALTSDVMTIANQKASLSYADKMQTQIELLQKNSKTVTLNVLSFMELFKANQEILAEQTKKKEIQVAMECIKTTIDSGKNTKSRNTIPQAQEGFNTPGKNNSNSPLHSQNSPQLTKDLDSERICIDYKQTLRGMCNTINIPSRCGSQSSTSRVPKKGRLIKQLIESNIQDIGIKQKPLKIDKIFNNTGNNNNNNIHNHSYTLSDVGMSVKVNKDLLENKNSISYQQCDNDIYHSPESFNQNSSNQSSILSEIQAKMVSPFRLRTQSNVTGVGGYNRIIRITQNDHLITKTDEKTKSIKMIKIKNTNNHLNNLNSKLTESTRRNSSNRNMSEYLNSPIERCVSEPSQLNEQ